MGINLTNFLTSKSKNTRMMDFQDLDHIDGLSISALCADLYKTKRDDLVMFYFRDGANHASVYTKSKIVSENIKWNLSQKAKKIYSLIVNTRNANAFTGKQGYESLKKIADLTSEKLSTKKVEDEDYPKKITSKEIIFGCTGTIGETFPCEKIIDQIPNLIKKINYTQNKFLWMKAALGIMTTDTKPKLAMDQCKIGDKEVKIYGVAKGSGMIFPNMGTTLAYIFTDANLSNDILSKLLKKNITNTFNSISCDGDTNTNDMVSIFSTNKANKLKNKNINEIKLKKVISKRAIRAYQNLVLRVPIAENVVEYAVDLVSGTRPNKKAKSFVNEWVEWGAGPRATQFLILGAKARAILNGRPAADIEDIKEMALPVLRHRVIPNFNAEAEGMKIDDIITKLL